MEIPDELPSRIAEYPPSAEAIVKSRAGRIEQADN
ncbi:hypothetical protein AvCA_41900 [Azotobacter vinelandii CA]|uniref:Uncharacterized protein n=2 Tax=Azotobacter vinelandii TaxID=354 RepID=C1DEY9_AZOVD|nr:hypothetical protein Avin_41900 [Azotobacter vinelandii DJ]AGK14426.1 hypothetical protein AvCA_41900 [Azotobacter vinelandii CA]AGK21844.1 hypothetical protein AvCA6_41900 [Azotobacter vinelandii CA6]